MLAIEADDIVKLARQFWNKAQPFELVLLKKQIVTMDAEKVTAVLESARLSTKFNVFPLQDINSRLSAIKKNGSGEHISCYVLNPLTGKNMEIAVMAKSNEGAKVELCRYLQQWGMEATDYILYISEESFPDFFNARHEVQCQLNPEIENTVAKIRSIGLRDVVNKVSENLPEIPKKPSINVGVCVKEMTEAVKNVKDEYDPDIPDDCPF